MNSTYTTWSRSAGFVKYIIIVRVILCLDRNGKRENVTKPTPFSYTQGDEDTDGEGVGVELASRDKKSGRVLLIV